MNKITRIREGFLSINRLIEHTIKRLMSFHANLVGDKVSGTGVKDSPTEPGIFGAILSWQQDVMHRLDVLNAELDKLQDNIQLQTVEYDKPESPDLDRDVLQAMIQQNMKGQPNA